MVVYSNALYGFARFGPTGNGYVYRIGLSGGFSHVLDFDGTILNLANPTSNRFDARYNMRYLMKQKLFCWGDDFIIKTKAGEEAFFVDGKAFSMGHKLSFQDKQKNELAFIHQKLLSWGPTYEITRNGVLAAVLKKHLFTLLRCKFTVDVPGPDDLEAQGSFLDMEYTFSRAGQTVAEVSKRWFSWTDTYGVEVHEGEDDVLILASTVVIDMVCHADRKRG